MKLSHIIYIGAAVAVSGASAQDLSTEITVDRTVVPRERPATRPARSEEHTSELQSQR